ncbi:hypothetical protein CTheo_5007 [Ceratobasidium theobromae]|uniref:C3H1-type domain-containing protein n=1 Tax=Ceratobasidium theobromae TaxID=1582974 RepID=A0A5N5QJA0_9AGAM|nr:hypothetical protein CTheo_5007 [Ceratobasidium theobromae]
MNHPALAGFDEMQRSRRAQPVLSAGDVAELTREEHRARFKHTKLCSFYQKGQCTRTFDACAFLHTDDPDVIARLGGVPANAPNPHQRPANADPHVNPRVNSLTGRPRPRFPPGSRIMGIGVPKRSKLGPEDDETKRTVCRFYASGMCEYGKDCRFLHVVPEPHDRQPSPKQNICRNYPACAYGDRCDFKHELDSPFSTASALPPSVSARASPAVRTVEPPPTMSLGERLGLLGERAGSSVVGDRPRRQELVRTASFGELPRRESGLLEERRASLLDRSLLRNGESPLARSSSLNVDRPFGSLLGLGLSGVERAHASQPHTRTHTPIPRAPSPSPTHIGIPPSRIAPHPATVLAPSGANTPSHPLIRTLPPPGNEYSGPGWRVASPLPPHISDILHPATSVPASPLALAPGSPLANAFGDGFFLNGASTPTDRKGSLALAGLERKGSSGLGFELGLGLDIQDETAPDMAHFESDGEGDVLPVVSYEDFDGFGTDHDDHDHPNRNESPGSTDLSKDRPRGYKTRECKYWAAGRCNQGDECPFKHTYGDDVEHGFDAQASSTDSRENPYWRTRPCKWFQQGQCLRGDSCNYLHTLDTAAPVLCKFYPSPGCRNGAECPFVHAELAEENEAEEEDSEDDVIFEPMRSVPGGAVERSPGGLSMLLSGLALSGHAQAQAQARAKVI